MRVSVELTVSRQTALKFKAEVHPKPVLPPLNLGFMQISRSCFKESKNPTLNSQSYV